MKQYDHEKIEGKQQKAWAKTKLYTTKENTKKPKYYVLDMFPDSAPTSASAMGTPVQSSTNRARAPGNTLAKGVNDDARDNAHSLHEFLLRAAVAL